MKKASLWMIGMFAVAVGVTGCSDDDKASNCGPGTVLSDDGYCVPVQPQPDTGGGWGGGDVDTGGGATDTWSNSDWIGGGDTSGDSSGGPDISSDTTDPTCGGEANSRDFGEACTQDCQCRTDIGGYCYNGPYLEGFRFCTRNGGLAGQLNAEVYPTLVFNSACWDFPAAQWKNPMVRACNSLADCKAISSLYTHCGTGEMDWAPGGVGTHCPNRANAEDPYGYTTMQSKNVCLINGLPPFNRR